MVHPESSESSEFGQGGRRDATPLYVQVTPWWPLTYRANVEIRTYLYVQYVQPVQYSTVLYCTGSTPAGPAAAGPAAAALQDPMESYAFPWYPYGISSISLRI